MSSTQWSLLLLGEELGTCSYSRPTVTSKTFLQLLRKGYLETSTTTISVQAILKKRQVKDKVIMDGFKTHNQFHSNSGTGLTTAHAQQP